MDQGENSREVLKVQNLYKAYKTGFIPRRYPVLKGITFSVQKGDIFGYLGPNGAGKTTTLKCILGLIFPDLGEISLFGEPHLSLKAKEKIGYLPENPYFYEYLTAQEFLNFYARLFPSNRMSSKDKINELLHLVGLERAVDLQLRKFSKGMLQRIGIAQALINDPELVFLDEPLGGLDPIGRKELRDVIVNLKELGKTVFICSHILQDIEMICDRVAIIVAGRLVAQGSLPELISEKILFTEITLSGLGRHHLEGLGDFVSIRGDRVLIKVFDENKIDQLLDLIREKKGKIHSMVPRTETLEDIFVDIVKQR